MDNLTTAEMIEFVNDAPEGVSAGVIERHFNVPRTTLNRRLAEAVESGQLTIQGKGRATRYISADPLAAVRRYLEKPYTERVQAPYKEALLDPVPNLSPEALSSLETVARHPLNKRELAKFLIDFSCASSVLEGGTYSLLDTQALIEYGEKSADKPLADAFLVLNHKEAFEYLYDHMSLDAIYKVQDLLTSDHDLPELKDSPHFLPKVQRGVVREHTDVDIRFSAYLPPYRPGTGYLQTALNKLLATAKAIENPVQSAFYLLTRIPYLQPFQDGNKRTSRALCNVPLIKAGLPPVSFVDFTKKDYIVAMLAFYELGDVRLAEQCFINAYQKSIRRLG